MKTLIPALFLFVAGMSSAAELPKICNNKAIEDALVIFSDMPDSAIKYNSTGIYVAYNRAHNLVESGQWSMKAGTVKVYMYAFKLNESVKTKFIINLANYSHIALLNESSLCE